MIGTVPYLGLYFSDLTYIDSAHPSTIPIEKSTNLSEKLINFEKHRKEFEILAQIKLFQSAANAYTNLHPLPRFKAWFDTVRIYTDMERFVLLSITFSLLSSFSHFSWDLSYQIEPKEVTDPVQKKDLCSRIYASQRLRV